MEEGLVNFVLYFILSYIHPRVMIPPNIWKIKQGVQGSQGDMMMTAKEKFIMLIVLTMRIAQTMDITGFEYNKICCLCSLFLPFVNMDKHRQKTNKHRQKKDKRWTNTDKSMFVHVVLPSVVRVCPSFVHVDQRGFQSI